MGGHWIVIFLLLLLQRLGVSEGGQGPGEATALDAVPRFTQPQYHVTVPENSAARTYVGQPARMGVVLADRRWDLRFKIVAGDGENLFKAEELVLGNFCFLRLRTKAGNAAVLNREVRDQYVLTVQALERRSGAQAQAQVLVRVLDANDLRPLFSPTSYSAALPDDTAPGASVARVSATDADLGTNGQFYYSFRQRSDTFAIHPTSGVVVLTGRLDHTQTPRYELDVLAADRGRRLYGGGGDGGGGVSSLARLTIRVEPADTCVPALTVDLGSVGAAEPGEPAGAAPLATVTVEDCDVGPSRDVAALSIVAGDPLGLFRAVRVAPGVREFWIQNIKALDWAHHPTGFNLSLQAQDGGSPPRAASAVRLLRLSPPPSGAGSQPLHFEEDVYRARVLDFAPPGTLVAVVRAVPDSPSLRYVLASSTGGTGFQLHPRTGLLSTREPLPARTPAHLELRVATADGRASTRVLVQVVGSNRHAPEFAQTAYQATFEENAPAGTSVARVEASDPDAGEDGQVTYSLPQAVPGPFSVDPFTGEVRTTEALDYELVPRIYTIRVRASDRGRPFRRETEVLVTLTLLNLNDNAPLFERVDCQAAVPRDQALGVPLATLSAIDADELQLVRYRLDAGDPLGLFHLDPGSGVLSLRQPLGISPSTPKGPFDLRVLATDGEHASVPLRINVTVTAPGRPVELRCRETGVARMLAQKLLQADRRSVHPGAGAETEEVPAPAVNAHAPRFWSGLPAAVAVSEAVPVGSVVAQLNASDADRGFDGKVVYALSGGNDAGHFTVDVESGLLRVLSPLDREAQAEYTLNVTAFDLGIPQRAAWRLLGIQILDANDNRPKFHQDRYEVAVSEAVEPGGVLVRLEAKDRDLGPNGEVRYRLLSDTDQFSVDAATGEVWLDRALDREAQAVHVLRVAAWDQAEEGPRLSSTALLTVTVEDVNDNAPVCIPPLQRVRVREDLPEGALVTWLEARDPDLGPAGQVRYGLLEAGAGAFELDRLSGALRLVRPLDFETRQLYNLTVRARDKGRPLALSATCHVEVEVVDVDENLHPPVFASFAVGGVVREDAPVGTSVLTLSARDEDVGRDGRIRYSIRDGSGLGVFHIDEEKGTIETAVQLDRETMPHYWLTVYATDQGATPLSSFTEVYIEVEDVNDNAPLTTQPVYHPAIPENSPKDVSVVQIEASDPDAGDQLTFRITSGNPQGFFAIHPKTGLITTTSRKLDREQQEEHILEVMVADSGSPQLTSVARVIVKVLDENDHKPQFLQKFYTIQLPERERSMRRVPVYRVIAADRDAGANAEISYSIEAGNEHGKFFIEPRTGLVSSEKASVAGEYDILTIRAVDNGRPQSTSTTRLHIEWTARPQPSAEPLSFEEPEFSFTVMESDPVSHMIGVITVEPPRTPLWFDIVGGDAESRFDVDKSTGTVIVARPLDAEKKSLYNLTVEATDGTTTIAVQVSIRVIDTNEHRPQFSSPRYEVAIPEDVAPEAELLRVHAVDGDEKNRLVYTLQSSTHPASLKLFRLDPATGALHVAETLDHEAFRQHVLTVMVRDQDVPVKRNFARIVVDVIDANDHAPWFTSASYEGQVYESAAVGSEVLQITAIDRDQGENAEVRYSIESGNVGNAFTIDPILGSLRTARELDQRRHREYMLVVRAVDRGLPPLSAETTAHVLVTLSDDDAPRFSAGEYAGEVSEAAPAGTPVAEVMASSRSAVFYELSGGNEGDVFSVNPHSGVITTRKGLDFEVRASYALEVRATNMAGQEAQAMVRVRLRDENDHAPVFPRAGYTGLVSEAAGPGSLVLTEDGTPLVVRAVDADSGANAMLSYHIVEAPARGFFTIDTRTGAVRTSAGLDYEHTAMIQFTVQAQDAGSPRLETKHPAHVIVRMVDVNDCPPVFSHPLYEALLLLPTYPDVQVLTLSATDADAAASAPLAYAIADGNTGQAFHLDGRSGVLIVRNATGLRSRYELTVRVSDGRFSDTTVVRVLVRQGPVGPLHFSQLSYKATVLENSTEPRDVVMVTLPGRPINEPLIFRILNPDDRFRLGPTSGVLSTTGVPFDREQQAAFDVVVEVAEAGGEPEAEPEPGAARAQVLVRVAVEDVNDNAPTFLHLPYSASVSVDAQVGHPVRMVTAVDRDTGRNGQVRYSLRGHGEHFRIGPVGEITLARELGPDALGREFRLTVVAEDGGDPALSAEAVVRIAVVGGAAPIFEQPFYRAEVPEDALPRSLVVHLRASTPEGLRVSYRIVDGDPLGQFDADFHTGTLHVAAPLDFEAHPAYKLTVRATDSLTGAHADVFVDIVVGDVNDNPPRFNQMAYAATLSEAAAIGTPVVWIQAADADLESGRGLTYHLDAGSDDDLFLLDRNSGAITLAGPLDYERAREHQLLVRAVDGGRPPLSAEVLVTVTVTNLNDHLPLFDQPLYEATVGELAAPGHLVTRVAAVDADGPGLLEYAIVAGNGSRLFSMDTTSGVITLAGRLPTPPPPTFELNVSVSDGVFRSETRVRVAVTGANQHAPTFAQSELEAELAESAPAGTLVATAEATDRDVGPYGLLAYSIVNSFAAARFRVDVRGRLFTIQELDRENPSERVVPVRLMARDGGGRAAFCTVSVILTDINDHAPRFRTAVYEADVGAGTPQGRPVFTVLATDADEGSNADVTYSLEADAARARELLAIDPRLGVISVRESLVGLDGQVLSFSVQARDGGSPPLATTVPVRVRVLPPDVRPPHFTEPFYSFAVPEDLPLGSEIGTLRADLGGAALDYSLDWGPAGQDNDPGEVFAVDRRSGRLTLLRSLDHEAARWYQLTVRARGRHRGHEVTASVDVSIRVGDVNDNSPVPEADPYAASVAENRPVGSPVVQVRASDPDLGPNGQVQYALDPAQDRVVLEAFAVHPDSGWLTTLRELDREERATFRVLVVASDCGERVQRSTTATVEVTVADENDNPPRFSAEVYKGTVSEADPPGGVVAVLSSSDADADEMNRRVTYYITGGDPQGQFAVEQSQDEWRVFVRRALDREERGSYLLNVTTTDGTFTADAVVEVKVLDANDNSPVCDKTLYTETIPEDSLPGRLVTQVSATDADIRTNAEITYTLSGPGAENFNLHSETGELKTFGPLDREQQASYHLLVTATDGGGRSCYASVQLWLDDVNDNAPVFMADPFTATVFENTEPRTPLTRVQATDADTGLNGKIHYSLVSPTDSHFSMDVDTGIVWLERSLDREVQAVHTLTVRAVDRGPAGQLSATATLVVSVLDINDNPPEFEYREYGGAVAEDVPVGTEVLRVYAASRDVEANAEITYAIISGNEHGRFGVDATTGAVFVSASLDYEQARDYCLTVEATDGGSPPLSDVATVSINVTDVNDHAPVFGQDSYTAVVSEDAAPDQSILTVAADDADGPSNSLIHYSIVDGNSGGRRGPFIIDPAKGHVILTGPLDRETVSGYTLTIRASDNGQPPRITTTTANIDVSDVNDNPPLFSPANHSVILQENKPVGFSVLQLEARDRDSSHNGPPFVFTVENGNEQGVFRLDANGLLTTAAPLDRRVRDRYRLRVKVTDSGKPPLSSTTLVDIRVIEESVHPPAILPLEILVVVAAADAATGGAASGGYAGGVIGKVHATDQDVYDTLTYSLDPGAGRLFSVTAAGGKLVARRGLEPGHYVLNVTVTDGRFSALAEVTVRVRRLGRVLLDHSVAVLFPGLGPEEFVGDYWRDVRRALATTLGVRRGHVHLLGLQPSEPPAPPALDALLLVEGPGGAPLAAGAVLHAINASAAELEELTGVRILGAYRRLCTGLRCPGQLCRERVTLDQQVVSTHSTARLSFVTPRHHRTAQCLCADGKCPVLSRGCENNPCPTGTDCVPDVEDEDAYTCVCPVTEGPCLGGSSVTFSGNGYVKYRLAEHENTLELKLTLRLRTLAANGVIMYAQGTDYSILEVHHGRLQYRFDCGSGPGIVSVQSAQLDDGQWHAVSLDVAGNHARLVLDRVHSASGTAPGSLKTLNLDHHVYLGGHIHSTGPRPGRTPQPGGGFRGCLDSVMLNGQELPPPGALPRGSAHIEAVVGISPGCSLSSPGDCSVSPCQNGGTCFPSPSGGIYCKCPALFLGPFCEVSTDPCASNPCLYGGTCVINSGDFSCQCRGRYSGHRCQLSPYCKFDPCQNGGTCFDSLDGAVCQCLHGFWGDRCQSDVDECMGSPCHNGALCENTPGSYRCNCSRAFRGQHCEDAVPNLYVSTPWNIGLAEGVGIVVFLAGVALLAVAFVACRRGLGRRRRPLPPNPEDKRPAVTAPFLHRPFLAGPPGKGGYPEVPPQVPVRPASYTPSVPSDSRNNLDRHSFEGSAIPEHPEFSTFSPDAGHGPRKAVAVCSVAPNLPPPPPSSSPSDSDSIRKPSWDFDYDAKEVELEPCLPKKALEEKGSQPYSVRGSLSEVQSLSSFQSESCDDNGYHWDTSDWMPAVVLPDIQEFPHHEALEPVPLLADPGTLEADYYPSGYDIESDFPPPPDDFPIPDDLPPLPPEFGDQFETLPPPRGGQRFDPSPYLPSFYPGDPSEGRQAGGGVGRGTLGPFPAGLPRGTGAAAVALATGFAPSSSDLSACCELESEAALSDYESGDDDEGCPFDDAVIPPLDAQQHTQV
ncbi:protocadherin Fat 1 [Tachyglossus aculeatus]|uniref:protocadherin Fat 1 n=1 Tax=Tachyglossus aculeatus TaxID=9261 RepID=UPI0018F3E488|nr:protocadherin Fat 1 [Tachyglossus aculeatus]